MDLASHPVQQQLQPVAKSSNNGERIEASSMEQQLALERAEAEQHLPLHSETSIELSLENADVRLQLATPAPHQHPLIGIAGAQFQSSVVDDTHLQLVGLGHEVPSRCQMPSCEREACRGLDGSLSLCLVHMLEQGVQPAYSQLGYPVPALGMPATWNQNFAEAGIRPYSLFCEIPGCKKLSRLSENGECSYCVIHMLEHGLHPANPPRRRCVMQDCTRLALHSSNSDYPYCEWHAPGEDLTRKRRAPCQHESCTRTSCTSADGQTLYCKVHMLLHGLPPPVCDPTKMCQAPGCNKRGVLASDHTSLLCMRHMAESGLQKANSTGVPYCHAEGCTQPARPGPDEKYEFCRQHQLDLGLWDGLLDHPRYPKKRGRPRTNPMDPELPALPKRPCAHPGCLKSAQAAADGPFLFCRGHQRCHGYTPPETRRRLCVEMGCSKFAVANTDGIQDYCKAHMRAHGQTPMAKMCILPDCTKRAQKGIDGKYAYCKMHLHEQGLHPGSSTGVLKKDKPSSSTMTIQTLQPATSQPLSLALSLPASLPSLTLPMSGALDATSMLLPGSHVPDNALHLLLLPSASPTPLSHFNSTELKALNDQHSRPLEGPTSLTQPSQQSLEAHPVLSRVPACAPHPEAMDLEEGEEEEGLSSSEPMTPTQGLGHGDSLESMMIPAELQSLSNSPPLHPSQPTPGVSSLACHMPQLPQSMQHSPQPASHRQQLLQDHLQASMLQHSPHFVPQQVARSQPQVMQPLSQSLQPQQSELPQHSLQRSSSQQPFPQPPQLSSQQQAEPFPQQQLHLLSQQQQAQQLLDQQLQLTPRQEPTQSLEQQGQLSAVQQPLLMSSSQSSLLQPSEPVLQDSQSLQRLLQLPSPQQASNKAGQLSHPHLQSMHQPPHSPHRHHVWQLSSMQPSLPESPQPSQLEPLSLQPSLQPPPLSLLHSEHSLLEQQEPGLQSAALAQLPPEQPSPLRQQHAVQSLSALPHLHQEHPSVEQQHQQSESLHLTSSIEQQEQASPALQPPELMPPSGSQQQEQSVQQAAQQQQLLLPPSPPPSSQPPLNAAAPSRVGAVHHPPPPSEPPQQAASTLPHLLTPSRLEPASGPAFLVHANALQRQVTDMAEVMHSQQLLLQQLKAEKETQSQLLDSHKHIVQQQQLRIDQLTVALQNCQHLATAAIQQDTGAAAQVYSQLLLTMQQALHSHQEE